MAVGLFLFPCQSLPAGPESLRRPLRPIPAERFADKSPPETDAGLLQQAPTEKFISLDIPWLLHLPELRVSRVAGSEFWVLASKSGK